MNGRPSVHGQVASCVIPRLWLRIAFEGTDLLIFLLAFFCTQPPPRPWLRREHPAAFAATLLIVHMPRLWLLRGFGCDASVFIGSSSWPCCGVGSAMRILAS